ncbi:MAG: hypothetical protein OHK006_06240 [Thermodesulfovibrionales bacterium]
MAGLARFIKNIALSNLGELKVPYKMTFALTYRCQLRCDMCGIWKRPLSEELSTEQIVGILKKATSLSWINLSGGEIFLRDDLPEILSAIARYCRGVYLLNFPTNGYQPDTVVDTIKTVLKDPDIPKVKVSVSIDGPPRLHDRIRNTPGSWDRAVETYRRLRLLENARFGVYFGMTLQAANLHAFPETVYAVQERIGDMHPRDFHVNIAHLSGHYYNNSQCSGIMPETSSVRERLAELDRLRQDPLLHPVGFLERRYRRLARCFLDSGRTPVPCQALSASFFMDPDGTVYPCTIFDRPIGNMSDFGYRLDRLWESEKRRMTRDTVRRGDCPQCWTPCEAYQGILANLVPVSRIGR